VLERAPLWWLHGGNRAIRAGDWKLVAAKGDPWSLYDLRTDRAESNDLADSLPDKVRALQALWDQQVEAIRDLAAKTPELSGRRPPRKNQGKK
ncbi:MAG: arylsulfatase, partial [Planctomycetes bacterium]|nr:arylsulfatase [Planctomycetota bacterium]